MEFGKRLIVAALLLFGSSANAAVFTIQMNTGASTGDRLYTWSGTLGIGSNRSMLVDSATSTTPLSSVDIELGATKSVFLIGAFLNEDGSEYAGWYTIAASIGITNVNGTLEFQLSNRAYLAADSGNINAYQSVAWSDMTTTSVSGSIAPALSDVFTVVEDPVDPEVDGVTVVELDVENLDLLLSSTFTEFDAEVFALMVYVTMLGLVLGVTGGWSLRVFRR